MSHVVKSRLQTGLSSVLTRVEGSVTYWSYTGFVGGAGLLWSGGMLHTCSGNNTKEGESGKLIQPCYLESPHFKKQDELIFLWCSYTSLS